MASHPQRTNLILLALLGLLGVGAVVKTFFMKSEFDTGETARASESLFAGFKKDAVATLVIDGPEEKKVELVKDGDHWNIASEGNFRADKTDVDRVLNGIEKLKRGKSASSKGDNLELFNLQKGKGITVAAYASGGKTSAPIAEFSIGKSTDDWKFAFVKLPKEAAVHKVEGSTSDFEAGYDNTWRDKTIFDHGDAAKVEEITVTGPKGALTLARKKELGPKDDKGDAKAGDTADADPAKSATDPAKSDPAKPEAGKPEQEVKETYWALTVPTEGRAKKWLADNLASHVAKLECDSFFAGTEKLADLGLEPPAYVASARREGETASTPVLYIGNKSKDGKYPVKLPKADDATVWWIPGYKGDYLTKSADELLETPPPKPDEKKPDEKKPDENPPKGDGANAPATPPDGGGSATPAEPAKPKDGDKPEDGKKPEDGGAKPEDGTKPGSGGG